MTSSRAGLRAHHWLSFLPTIGMLGGILFANRVHPLVLGIPFLFFWIAAWVVATSLVMWVILKLDRRYERVHGSSARARSEGVR